MRYYGVSLVILVCVAVLWSEVQGLKKLDFGTLAERMAKDNKVKELIDMYTKNALKIHEEERANGTLVMRREAIKQVILIAGLPIVISYWVVMLPTIALMFVCCRSMKKPPPEA
ncbi:hypothetical protein M3Y94_00619800 [Aphelenchoides besseyi]|nr:hypothetical protein M3Y94_00619800 [Aphelenchoides besseyi]